MSESVKSLIRRLGAGRQVRRKHKFKNPYKNTFHKQYRMFPEDMPLNLITKPDMSQEMFLGLTDLSDHITSKIVSARTNEGLPTFVEDFSILASREQWLRFIQRFYNEYQVVQLTNRSGMLIKHSNNTYFKYDIHSSTIGVQIYGDATTNSIVSDSIRTKFEEVLTEIEWVYSSDGASIDIPLRADRQPVDEMYPFLGEESLEDYYDRFMESSASILLLIGPPGTGKTSFIRGLMQHTHSSAVVSYDEAILSKDYVFAQFIEGEQNMMVIEDADMFLKARAEGNTTMHKFLNIGDGLVTTRNKKLIFSTNLPSVRDIDPALIRPGRCFDVLSFDLMSQEQAEKLASKMNVTLSETKDKWTIADVFHKQTFEPIAASRKNKLGFV